MNVDVFQNKQTTSTKIPYLWTLDMNIIEISYAMKCYFSDFFLQPFKKKMEKPPLPADHTKIGTCAVQGCQETSRTFNTLMFKV